MKIKINDTVVTLHVNTYSKIVKIAREKNITFAQAISYCLQKVK